VAGMLIVISSLWFNVAGWEILFHLGPHRVPQTFQSEYRIRRVLQKHGLKVYHVVRQPEFIIYAKSFR
jgi:hypothetical protein